MTIIKDGGKMYFVDLHIHSRFSRACSKQINVENLEKWARVKGIDLLGTGDFTHPEWLQELKENLNEKDGILYTKTGFRFVLSSEISLIYTQERGRRIHLVLLAPNFEAVDKINSWLDSKGRRDYDGRPIFKISCEDFVAKMAALDEKIEVIPAHCLIGETIIHTNHSIKKIKDIKEGDVVYTHRNRWQKVKEVLKRPYSGKVYKIRPWYFTEGLTTTSEHPFYAIKSYKCSWIKGVCKKSCSKLKECKNKRFETYLRRWVSASELRKGDFLVYPRFNNIEDKKEIQGFEITSELCRLIGYYLAEGYTIREEAIGFSFNKNEEDYIKDVVYLIREIFEKDKFKIDERKGKDLIFYSKKLNKFFSQFYNSKIRRAFSKFVPSFMLDLPLNKQIEIFKGWYRGDKGYTISRELMNQMKIICLRLGIIPNTRVDSVENYEKRGKHFINGRRIKANYDLYSFSNLSFFEDKFGLLKDKEFRKFKTRMSRRHGWIDENYIYLPIRKIEIKNYQGVVYNLEVEEDNSYVSEFACIHNCWTPWFGLYGSESGFDSLQEAFGSQLKKVHAVETGISSTPDMNLKLNELQDKTIVSFSDLHSFWPWRLGREATIFSSIESYDEILKAIRENKILGTIEVDPAYGKYHFDGHRNCEFSCSPKKTKELNGICPVCKKKLLFGVDHRVEDLANSENMKTDKIVFQILPLHELISFVLKKGMNTKTAWGVYNKLIEKFGNEFNVLLEVSKEDLLKVVDVEIVEMILKNRKGDVRVKPGYDGVYGEMVLGDSKDEEDNQERLF